MTGLKLFCTSLVRLTTNGILSSRNKLNSNYQGGLFNVKWSLNATLMLIYKYLSLSLSGLESYGNMLRTCLKIYALYT